MAPAAAQVDNTTRRKWDKDEFAAKAKERERLEDEKEKGKNIRPPPGAMAREASGAAGGYGCV